MINTYLFLPPGFLYKDFNAKQTKGTAARDRKKNPKLKLKTLRASTVCLKGQRH